jgi:hypothetical protein
LQAGGENFSPAILAMNCGRLFFPTKIVGCYFGHASPEPRNVT